MRVWLEEAQGALAKASGIDTLGLKVLESERSWKLGHWSRRTALNSAEIA